MTARQKIRKLPKNSCIAYSFGKTERNQRTMLKHFKSCKRNVNRNFIVRLLENPSTHLPYSHFNKKNYKELDIPENRDLLDSLKCAYTLKNHAKTLAACQPDAEISYAQKKGDPYVNYKKPNAIGDKMFNTFISMPKRQRKPSTPINIRPNKKNPADITNEEFMAAAKEFNKSVKSSKSSRKGSDIFDLDDYNVDNLFRNSPNPYFLNSPSYSLFR